MAMEFTKQLTDDIIEGFEKIGHGLRERRNQKWIKARKMDRQFYSSKD